MQSILSHTHTDTGADAHKQVLTSSTSVSLSYTRTILFFPAADPGSTAATCSANFNRCLRRSCRAIMQSSGCEKNDSLLSLRTAMDLLTGALTQLRSTSCRCDSSCAI
eukprot:173779-Rhodomonas_salina.1